MSTTLPASATASVGVPRRTAGRVVQAALAMLLGIGVIGIAGFSHVDVIHNAAHDTRHASGFPCH
jgi:cobalt transporter subunit CbtB